MEAPVTLGCMEEAVLHLLGVQGHFPASVPDLWDTSLPPHAWKGVLARWLLSVTGKRLRYWPSPPRRPGTLFIAVGTSPRRPEIRHAIVASANPLSPSGLRIVYDPHPSGAGVLRPDSFYWW